MTKKPVQKWVIGIDEAGRGPLAGPVAVGVALVPAGFDFKILEGLRDSKKLTPEKREALFRLAAKLKKEGRINFAVGQASASIIDKKGIVPAIKQALEKALRKVLRENNLAARDVKVYLDGSLKAPADFTTQETIIKGDDLIPAISLASVLAKVTRDRVMVKLSSKKEFKVYDFATHKGYGTKVHLQAIKKHGLSQIHRRSFCTRFCSQF